MGVALAHTLSLIGQVWLVQICNSLLCILKSMNIKMSHWYYSEVNYLIMRPGRCSNRAVSTLRGGDDAITGKRAAFFIRELQAQRKREDSSVQQRKRERCGRSRIRATQQHSSRDSSQSGTEEHPPTFSHKTAPVKQKRARRSCRYSLYRFCAVYDRFWLP